MPSSNACVSIGCEWSGAISLLGVHPDEHPEHLSFHFTAYGRYSSWRYILHRSLSIINVLKNVSFASWLNAVRVCANLVTRNITVDGSRNTAIFHPKYSEMYVDSTGHVVARSDDEKSENNVPQCHYQGRVRGSNDSIAVFSTCTGSRLPKLFKNKHVAHHHQHVSFWKEESMRWFGIATTLTSKCSIYTIRKCISQPV